MDHRRDPLTKPLMLSDLVANFQRLSSSLPPNDWGADPSIRQLQREDSGILNFCTVENENKNVLSSNAVAASSGNDAPPHDTSRLPRQAERDFRSGTTGENRPSKKRGRLWGVFSRSYAAIRITWRHISRPSSGASKLACSAHGHSANEKQREGKAKDPVVSPLL